MLFVCHPKILHKHCLQFLLGVKMAPRETENNTYAKFWGDKQRALWYVMVFLEWSITKYYQWSSWSNAKRREAGISAFAFPCRGTMRWCEHCFLKPKAIIVVLELNSLLRDCLSRQLALSCRALRQLECMAKLRVSFWWTWMFLC